MRSAPARIGSGRRRTGPAPRAVIDASIAMKWLVEEEGTAQALALRGAYGKLIAPDLLVPECANVLWKKTKRGEVLPQEARLMARLLSSAEIELVGTRSFLEAATNGHRPRPSGLRLHVSGTGDGAGLHLDDSGCRLRREGANEGHAENAKVGCVAIGGSRTRSSRAHTSTARKEEAGRRSARKIAARWSERFAAEFP